MSTISETLDSINEVNLSYLLLAQCLLREDRASGMSHLGISGRVADVLENLSPAQTIRLAASTQMLCRFRFDHRAVLSCFGKQEKETTVTQSRAAIPVEDQPVGQPDRHSLLRPAEFDVSGQ